MKAIKKHSESDLVRIGLPDWFTKNTQICGTTKYLTLNRPILFSINNILYMKLLIWQMRFCSERELFRGYEKKYLEIRFFIPKYHWTK